MTPAWAGPVEPAHSAMVDAAAAVERPVAVVRVRLDWSDPSHWSRALADCRRCGTAAFGRDEQGRPMHQACAEEELGAELLGHVTAGDVAGVPDRRAGVIS